MDLARPLHELPDPLPVPSLVARGTSPFQARIRPPGSKSLTNRALLLAALASGESMIRHPLLAADDTERMIDALSVLGARFDRQDSSEAEGDLPGELRVAGVDGRWRPPRGGATLNLNNAGTATRFLAAAALLSPSPITIDGNARMRERPIGQLIESLEQLSATCEYLADPGHPPVRIAAPPVIAAGQRLRLSTTTSSQFISALLLIAPFVRGGLTLELTGELTSPSYVKLTLGLLHELGAAVRASEDLRTIHVGPASHTRTGLPAFTCTIEPDASSATYFWGAASLFPGASCQIVGISPLSLQPDAGFPDLLAQMGASVILNTAEPSITVHGPRMLDPITADLSLMPDAAMTLAAVACFAEGRSVIRGLRTLRHKETDRIAALRNELMKIGAVVETSVQGDHDALAISPPRDGIDTSAVAPRVEFETYDDHRMAMALALIGLQRPNTFIRAPSCVAKTYPGFWRDLGRLYG